MDISQIRDIRSGSQAKLPRDQRLRDIIDSTATSGSTEPLEHRTVTVAYGTDFVNVNFVNFSSQSVEVAKVGTNTKILLITSHKP